MTKSVQTRNIFLRILLFTILATTGIATCSLAFAQHNPTVRIGAWNIEWLGTPHSRSGIAKDVAQTPADVAAYIEISDVSLLSLEEIGDDNPSDHRLTNSTLDEAFAIINRTGANWTYLIFPKDDQGSRNQCIGVAWDRNRVERIGEPFRVPINHNNRNINLWDRTPYAIKFSFGNQRTDIVVIPLHMKSNVGGVQPTRVQRGREAEHLVDALDALYSHFSDQDLVLLGDTNVLRANEPAAVTFRQAGFKDLNQSDMPTTFHGSAPFDRIFVRQNQAEFANAAQEKIELAGISPDEHKKRLSDHYMVVTSVQILSDDDGNNNADLASALNTVAPCGCADNQKPKSDVIASPAADNAAELRQSVLHSSMTRSMPYGVQGVIQNYAASAPTNLVGLDTSTQHIDTPELGQLRSENLRLKLALQRTQLEHASEALGDRGDRRFQEKANVLRDAIWRNRTINVSWENPSDSNKDEREWVRAAVTRTWEKESGLKFVGWAPSDANSDGIRILIDDSQPHCKGLGTRIKNVPNGMVLNLSFQNWCPPCLQNRQGAIEKIAIHEFGHAIGFAHEQNRDDAPDWCRNEHQGSSGDWYITLYDPNSIMNYCNDLWNNDGRLSALDIEAVRTLYGQPDN